MRIFFEPGDATISLKNGLQAAAPDNTAIVDLQRAVNEHVGNLLNGLDIVVEASSKVSQAQITAKLRAATGANDLEQLFRANLSADTWAQHAIIAYWFEAFITPDGGHVRIVLKNIVFALYDNDIDQKTKTAVRQALRTALKGL